MKLSLIIPAYNEKESLPELFSEIHNTLNSISLSDYEIIVVDDGSTDGTYEWIHAESLKDTRIKGIRFRQNLGKAAALATGFERCKGDYVITLDGDLQDNPAEIPDFLKCLENGADMVSGWKKKRFDPFHKTLPSKLFNGTVRLASGLQLHDFNCGFKAYRKEVVKSIDLYGEMHRYIPVLAHWKGFKVEEKVVQHRSRQHGKSKYGFARLSNGMFDLLTLLFLHRYNSRPLHLFGFLGMFCCVLGTGILSYFAIQWMLTGNLHIRPLLLGGIAAILFGFQVISLGLLAELITHSSKREYPIGQKTDNI